MTSTCPRCEKQVSIPAGVDSAALVRCPLCAAEYPLSEVLASLPPELIPVDRPAVGDWPLATHEPAAESDRGEGAHSQHDAEGENEAAAVARQFPGVSAATAARRRRRKPKSALQTLIEVVTGGMAGLLVGYYALAFYLGPEFRNRVPQLPLPGISWITAPRAAIPPEEMPADEKPLEPKAGATNHPSDDEKALPSEAKNRKV
jgi:hypothetical protein